MARHNQYLGIIKDIIEEESLKGNKLKANLILSIIEDRYGEKAVERKAVGHALEVLRSEYCEYDDGTWRNPKMCLRYTVEHRVSSDKYSHYWFEFAEEDDEDKLTDGEIMFLMDAVQFSRHINQKTADSMMKKLLDIAGKNFRKNVPSYKKIDDNYRPVSSDFFMFMEDINEAIRIGRKISFYNTEYNAKLKRVRAGNRTLVVNPISVVCFDGNYYLIYREAGSLAIKNCRVDMIGGVKMLDEDSDVDDMEVRNVRKHPEEYIVEHLYMSSGEPVEAVLQIDRSILSDLVDAFGNKIGIDEADEGSNNLTVHIRSSEKGIIDWSLKYGEFATVIEPEYLRNQIRDRASQIQDSYVDRDTDVYYMEMIDRGGASHGLVLANIDLNGRDSYQHLRGIRRAVFRHNGITDFSFLGEYSDLVDLTISNNRIGNPDVIAELGRLTVLNLKNTGISDLDFLRGNAHLKRLSINEITLENADAVYEIPRLRFLNVSKPVARLIDKNRLRAVYGDELEYTVGDGYRFLPMVRGDLPRRENRMNRRDAERIQGFTTFAVDAVSIEALAFRLYPGQGHSEMMFSIIEGGCDSAERTDIYEHFDLYITDDYVWYVTYDGTAPGDVFAFDVNKVYAISVYKKDHGQKLVFMAKRNITRTDSEEEYRDLLEKTSSGSYVHIRSFIDDRIGWAEVSGELERMMCRSCTIDEVIKPTVLRDRKIIDGIKIDEDDYHYSRKEAGGKKSVRRIAYGHIVD